MFKSHAFWLAYGLLIFNAIAQPVQAGAVVELRYADLGGAPIEVPSQGFNPGDQFLVEVWMKPDQDILIRGLTISYQASSSDLIPGFGLDIDTVNQPPDEFPNFWYDYSGAGLGTYPANGFIEPFPGFFVSTAGDYLDFSNLRSSVAEGPVGTATSSRHPNSNMKSLTSGVFNRVGGMPITIPNDIVPGIFIVDLLNSENGSIDDSNFNSALDFGFGLDPDDPVTIWSTATDDPDVTGSLGYALGGGPLEVPVLVGLIVPEPSTILLFACGLCFVIRSINKRKSFA